ncbi:hypothetical protein [Lacrimispora sp.]|uniref:hypothetical protein n=1 Tax=Lacrimispora sp. TaxID=2719234 RepID=UPI002898B796|nr:hypothetical protein [Lacrimispora sp.]
MWNVDFSATQSRNERLKELYDKEGLNADTFHCKYFLRCEASQRGKCVGKQYAGGTAAISPFYDISYNGIPMRTLVVGKETGYMKNEKFGTSPNFEENCSNVLNCINWKNKNNHIKGTLMILKYIFQVNTEYIYSSYALSNSLRCAFQDTSKIEKLSSVSDTKIMRDNCIDYLFEEIDILEPNLIICQGEWSIRGKDNFIEKISKRYDEKPTCLRKNSNGKYGLYKFYNFYVLTCHHPAILGNWIKNLAPDSVWPAIDNLRENGALPQIDNLTSTKEYEALVKSKVDAILDTLQTNDRLRGRV